MSQEPRHGGLYGLGVGPGTAVFVFYPGLGRSQTTGPPGTTTAVPLNYSDPCFKLPKHLKYGVCVYKKLHTYAGT